MTSNMEYGDLLASPELTKAGRRFSQGSLGCPLHASRGSLNKAVPRHRTPK